MKGKLDALLLEAVENAASDLHLIIGNKPYIRENDIIMEVQDDIITAGDLELFYNEVLTEKQQHILNQKGDVDLSYTFLSQNKIQQHCRINFFKEFHGYSLAARFLSEKIPTYKDLRIPESIMELLDRQRGLIIISGPTGCGKTTSIAAMVEYVNTKYAYNIIKLEDPIEYIHQNRKSIIRQREIGRDLKDFAQGLKASLRENPNVIVIGEMRDKDTVRAAINAAETGHLVLATLHTGDAIEAVDRLLQYFPETEKKQVLSDFSNCFVAIIVQKLLLGRDNKTKVLALEVLQKTPAIVNLIRTEQAHKIRDYMHSDDGMQTMDEAIEDLKNRKLI
jgi:pilus retraction protein PilT